VQKIGHLTLLDAVRTHRVAMQLTGLCNSMTGGTIYGKQNHIYCRYLICL